MSETPGYSPESQAAHRVESGQTLADELKLIHGDTLEAQPERPNLRELDIPSLERTYEALDPQELLNQARELTPEQEASPNRVKIISARLGHLRHQLARQALEVSRTVRNLYDTIETNPDASYQELWGQVADAAADMRLDIDQLTQFDLAIKNYLRRHRIVKETRRQYPNDAQLFQQAFGQLPHGRVEVIEGPMTLSFRCYEEEDLVAAYTMAPSYKASSETRERVKKSGGFAHTTAANSELNGTLIVERPSLIPAVQEIERRGGDFIELPPGETYAAETGIIELICVGNEQGEEWSFEIVPDMHQPGEGVKFYEIAGPDENRPPKLVGVDYTISAITQDGQAPYNFEAELHLTPQDLGAEFSLNVQAGAVEVVNHGTKPLEIAVQTSYVEHIDYDEVDEERSREVRSHEEQHQYNKLVANLEHPPSWQWYATQAIQEVSEAYSPTMTWEELGKRQQAAVTAALKNSAAIERYRLADKRARDEIISYYRDGSSVDRIQQTLATNKLYDYADQAKDEIADMDQRILTMTRSLFYSAGFPDEVTAPTPESAAIVQQVFGSDYQRDLARWTGAIAAMEAKGYNRDEVRSLLETAPAAQWPGMARRLPQV